jgi:hypothetical protein
MTIIIIIWDMERVLLPPLSPNMAHPAVDWVEDGLDCPFTHPPFPHKGNKQATSNNDGKGTSKMGCGGGFLWVDGRQLVGGWQKRGFHSSNSIPPFHSI